MADEITCAVSISAGKGGSTVNSVGTSSTASDTYDLAGDHMANFTQAIGTGSDEALDIPADVTPIGWLYVKNMDATNYVELSTATGGSFAGAVFEKLLAGQKYMGHPTATTIYAKANTAACNIHVVVIEP